MEKSKIGRNTVLTLFKRHAATFILGCFFALLIFNPAVKPWILERLVSIGLFRAAINKADSTKNIVPVKNFNYTDLHGNISSISSLKGQVVFINFWASWCPPCRAEMPSINNLYLKFKDNSRITFLFFNEDNDKGKALAYLQKNNFRMPLFFTFDSIPEDIFTGSLPTTIVLNKKGEMVFKHEGMAGYDTKQFIEDLNKLF